MLVTEGYLRNVIRRVILEKFSVVLPDTTRTGGSRPDKAWRRKSYRRPDESGNCPSGWELSDDKNKCYLIGTRGDEEEVPDDPDESVAVCDDPWSLADCETSDNEECDGYSETDCYGEYQEEDESCLIINEPAGSYTSDCRTLEDVED
jgi:hypothetical protein